MSGFSIAWLDLREPADRAARDKTLAAKALAMLANNSAPLVVDLGSGTGSTLRALQGLPTRPLTWRLLDHDAALLAEAMRRHAHELRLSIHEVDLMQVATLPLQQANLVSASALFDLVSEDFIARLCARITAQGSGLYVALNYDGAMRWQPAHPLDEHVLEAFNRDQRRDKGFGPALGPAATQVLSQHLQAAGYRVETAASPWQLGPEAAAMVTALITGIAEAVRTSLGDTATTQWQDFRLQHVQEGHCFVGHTDLLALPAQ